MNEAHGETPSDKVETSSPPSNPPQDHEVPDPDDDDLDDLDELLDAFSTSNPKAQQPDGPAKAPQQNGPTGDQEPSHTTPPDDFTKQLQAQMAALMGNGDESEDMQKEIQTVLQELGAKADSTSTSEPIKAPENPSVPPVTADESFQDAILKTMQRMQNSGDKASAAATSGEGPDDILANMLKDFQSGGSSGASGDEDFSKMLMNMMENLTNKEILYDPMKELHDKFPPWLMKNKANVKAADLRRYEQQQQIVAEIVGKFEESTYSDDNTNDRQYIVERMQKMQEAGSPPADLVGDMSGAQEALQDMDIGCPQQ
ncbi:MAG: hypothetical protein Q9183_002284 [Haloplaca sp. 2 TL-2023]